MSAAAKGAKMGRKSVALPPATPTPPVVEPPVEDTLSLVSQIEFLRTRIADLSGANSQQVTDIAALQSRLSSVSSGTAPTIESLQSSLRHYDSKLLSLHSDLAALHESFKGERLEAEHLFHQSLAQHGDSYTQSLDASHDQYLALVDNRARIESYQSLSQNMKLKIAEFERRLAAQRSLHAAKCREIVDKWEINKLTVDVEKSRKNEESKLKYKNAIMKMMNISYQPMREEIEFYKREKVHETSIIRQLSAENRRMKHEMKQLSSGNRRTERSANQNIRSLVEIKLAIRQRQREGQQLVEEKMNIAHEYVTGIESQNSELIAQYRALMESLRSYSNAAVIHERNVRSLLAAIDRMERIRASNQLEYQLIDCIDYVRKNHYSDSDGTKKVTVRAMSPSDRTEVLSELLRRMHAAEQVRRERQSMPATINSDSERLVTLTEPSLQLINDTDPNLNSADGTAVEDDSFLLPLESEDVAGSFFLTQLDFEDSSANIAVVTDEESKCAR